MGYTAAVPAVGKKTLDKDAPKAKLSLNKNGTEAFVWLSFPGHVAKDLFGENCQTQKFDIQVGHGIDQGKLRIVDKEDGKFSVRCLVGGGISIKIKAWDLLLRASHESACCKILEPEDDGWFLLELPSWSKRKDTTLNTLGRA